MDTSSGELQIFTEDKIAIKKRNTILLDYLLWDFTWDFERADISDSVDTVFPRFNDRPDIIFKIEKLSEKEFEIHLSLGDGQCSLDEGCFYEFIFTVFGYKGTLKRRVMDYASRSVKVRLNFIHVGETQKEGHYWVMKCIIKMHEIDTLDNSLRRQQEGLIEKLVQNEEYRDKISDMAYLLEKESLTDIFTGRLDLKFAEDKRDLIERTLPFADEIAAKYRKGSSYRPSIPIDVYLNHILHGVSEPINKYDAIKLYIMAYHYGLPYLANECRDYMLANIDPEYLVHVLMYADMAQDLDVMHTGFDEFIKNKNKVMKTKAWASLNSESRLFIQNIIDGAIRRLRHLLEVDIKKYTKQAAGKEPEEKSASGEEPKEKSASGEEPEEKSASGEEPEEKSASGEEPEEKSASGEEPEEKSLPVGDEPVCDARNI